MKGKVTLMATLALATAMSLGSAVFADTVTETSIPVVPEEPVSYVTVDAGTEVELTLDSENNVIEATSLETDGADLIGETDLTGQPVKAVVDLLVDEALETGVLPADGTVPVEISVASDDPAVVTEVTDAITDTLTDVAAEEVPVPVVYQNAALERIALAKQLGITPGKLNLIQKYAASVGDGEPVVVADWTTKSVKEIMGAIKENRKAAQAPDTDVTEETDVTVTTETIETVTAEATAVVEKAPKAEPAKEKSKGNSSGSKGGKNK